MNMGRLDFLFFAFCFLLYSVPGHADSRAAIIAEQKAEKAKHLHVYTPSKAEGIITRLTSPRHGFYPYFGSAFSGGGLALGPGYFRTFGDNGTFDIHGAWSIENYTMLQTNIKLPDLAHLAGGRLSTRVNAKYVNAGHLSYFGLGNDSQKDDESDFEYRPINVGFTETYQPVKWFSVGGGVEYLHPHTGPGDSGSLPQVDDEFPPSEIPGFEVNPDYVNTSLFAVLDWRQTPGYTTSGGLFRALFTDYNQQGNAAFSFLRYDAEVDQYFPLWRANQIIAVRALVSITQAAGDEQVPFYLMPRLGGARDLRGFRGFRFRDRHRLLLTAEYRWTPSKMMDLALFYERGKVASVTSDLDFTGLHYSIGIGARFHAPNATILRIEFAHSNEYNRIIFDTGLLF